MRILLVDDDDISREMMFDSLSGLFGYDITQCQNGKEALEFFKSEPFALVITDIKMPEMNGIDLLHNIKKLPEGKNTKIIFSWVYGK